MLTEWLWKNEYFVNLKKSIHNAKHFGKNYLIYGKYNIVLATRDKLTFVTSPSEVDWFISLISFTL